MAMPALRMITLLLEFLVGVGILNLYGQRVPEQKFAVVTTVMGFASSDDYVILNIFQKPIR